MLGVRRRSVAPIVPRERIMRGEGWDNPWEIEAKSATGQWEIEQKTEVKGYLFVSGLAQCKDSTNISLGSRRCEVVELLGSESIALDPAMQNSCWNEFESQISPPLTSIVRLQTLGTDDAAMDRRSLTIATRL
jgi:hypothetical protein